MCSNVPPNTSLECNSITITALNERIRLPHMDTPICDQEFSALNRKLESKSEALRILRKKLEQSCNERDEFKLMAESLQLRYAMKGNNALDVPDCRDKSSVAALLHGTRESNFKLSIELDGLKQKLKDVNSDLEVLRNSRERILPAGPQNSIFSVCSQNRIQKWELDRQLLISQLEALKLENVSIASDMKFLIDEKEEILKERDAYRCKAHRLNHELFTALKTNQNQPVIDVDSLLLENNYLHECLKNQELELQTSKESIDKYKAMLESQSNKNSKNNYKENVVTENQVKQVIDSCLDLPTKTETINDLKELCVALFDKLNDNNVALCHQKNANKMLGKKITELEERLQLLAGIREPNTKQYFSLSQLLLEGSSTATINSNSSSPTREICANQSSIQNCNAKSFSENSRITNTQALNIQPLREFCAEVEDKELETYTKKCFERATSNKNSPIGLDHRNCECGMPGIGLEPKPECRDFVRNQIGSNANSDESSFFISSTSSDMKNLQDACECINNQDWEQNSGFSLPSSDRHESRSPEASTSSSNKLCRDALKFKGSETSFLFQILGSNEELSKTIWSNCVTITPRQSISHSLKAAENKQTLNEGETFEDNTTSVDPEQKPKDKNSPKSISRKKNGSKKRSSSAPHVKPKKSTSNADRIDKTKSNQTRQTGKSKRLSRRSTATKSVDRSTATSKQSTDPLQRLTGGSTLVRSKSVSHASQTDKSSESNLQKTLYQQGNSFYSVPSLGSHENFTNCENLLDVKNFIDNNQSTTMNPIVSKLSKSESLLFLNYGLKDTTGDNNEVEVKILTSQEIGRSNYEEMTKEKSEQKTIENKGSGNECQYAQDTLPCKQKDQQNATENSNPELVKRRKKRCSCSQKESVSEALNFIDSQKYYSRKDFGSMDSIKLNRPHADYSSSSSCEDCKIKDELAIGTTCRPLQPNLTAKEDSKPKTSEYEDCKQLRKNIIILPFHNAKDKMDKIRNKREYSSNSSSPKAFQTKAIQKSITNEASRYVDPQLSNEMYETVASKGLQQQTHEDSIDNCPYESTNMKHISDESFSSYASNHPLNNLLNKITSESECEQPTFKESFKCQHSPRASKQSDFEPLDDLVFTSASSESEHSSASSVYSEVMASENMNSLKTDPVFSRRKTYDPHNQYMYSSIERERLAALSDLPPDIARICLQNLRELDEFADKVNSTDSGCGTCPPEHGCSCTLLQRRVKHSLNLLKHSNYADDDTDI